MSNSLVQRLFDEIERIRIIDPHSHINPHAATSRSLHDILSYHYYTELAHSAGLARSEIEAADIAPEERVRRLVEYLPRFNNTAQYRWLLEICREFLDPETTAITADNWWRLYETSIRVFTAANWESELLERSGLDAVFLTNDFDDPLMGFDTRTYIPCLRTDDLVFHLATSRTRQRFEAATGCTADSAASLREGIQRLFARFVDHAARACAISLPPDFTPATVPDADLTRHLQAAFSATDAGKSPDAADLRAIASGVFWMLCEHCQQFQLPFDLMIGVNRKVYAEGVFQGQDLFDQRVSLVQYRAVFNAFPTVTFPVSVLANTSNQELVSHAWIYPNVVTHGHWWYSNIPAYIEADTRTRLQAVPRSKQIGYYSDMYRLEFGLPKFRMYRRCLAKVLAEEFVIAAGWTEEQCVALAFDILRGNVERIFKVTA